LRNTKAWHHVGIGVPRAGFVPFIRDVVTRYHLPFHGRFTQLFQTGHQGAGQPGTGQPGAGHEVTGR
jgi:hypothetical protein